MKRDGGGSKFGRIVKAPFRALCRVRDLYVSSLTGCAGRGNYRGIGGFPGGGAAGVPRSYSFHPSRSSSTREDDLRDLMRAASQGTMGSLNLSGGGFQQASPGKAHAGSTVVPRSQSVAIGRIDEDKPFELGMDATLGPLVPRSRSCAVSKGRVGILA